MKCQKCVNAGLKSIVYAHNALQLTLMAFQPFYNEDGIYHCHDPNTHSESWSCSNGHGWFRKWQNACPAPNCGWNDTRRDQIVWLQDKITKVEQIGVAR